MANEFRLNFTGSEINRKLEVIDELQGVLEHNYYTSDEIDTKIDEVSTDINVKFGAAGSSLEAGLATKADLVGGKVPVAQLPDDLVDLSNYYTKSDVDNEIIIVNEDTDAKLVNKADLVDGKVPLEQLPDNIGSGSGGGLTEVSWEDVKNKPFEDTRVMSYYSQAENPNPVSFHNQMMNYSFYKISDLTPTREQIFGELKVLVDGNEITLAENAIIVELDGCLAVGTSVGTSYTFAFINTVGTINFTFSGYPMTLEVPETGIYAILPLNSGVPANRTYEIICGGELKTIDIKYLPENMALGYEEKGEGITWDGNTDGLTEVVTELEVDGTLMGLAFYKMSDKTPSISEMVGRQQSLSGVDGESSEIVTEGSCSVFADNGSYMVGDVFIIVCLSNDTTLPLVEMMGAAEDITFPEAGIWFAKVSVGGAVMMQAASLRSPDTLVPIDEKFIPDTIARKSDLDDIDLSNYYTKDQTYSRDETNNFFYNKFTIDSKLANVSVDLSEYYTKSEIDAALDNVSVDLSGYYTKDEVDTSFGQYYTKTSMDDKLSGYYTKSNVYTKTEINNDYYTKSNVYTKTEIIDGYYTKAEIDEITGDINIVLDEISALIGE